MAPVVKVSLEGHQVTRMPAVDALNELVAVAMLSSSWIAMAEVSAETIACNEAEMPWMWS